MQSVTLSADLLEANDNLARAQGHAHLESGGLTLSADAVQANLDSGDVSATGLVTLAQDARRLTGQALAYNLKSRAGRFEQATVTSGLAVVRGREILIRPDRYTALDGSFTTCAREPPDFQITARELIVYPGNRAVVRHASFWVRNHRLFTLPEHSFSLAREQAAATGLFPRVGFSRSDGLFVGPAYGYAPSRRLVGHAELRVTARRGLRVLSDLTSYRRWGRLSLSVATREDLGERPISLTEPGTGLANVTLDRLPEASAHWKPVRLFGRLGLENDIVLGHYRESPHGVSAARAEVRTVVGARVLRLGRKSDLRQSILLRPDWYSDGDHRFIWASTTTLEVAVSRAVQVKLGYFENHLSGSSPFRFDRVDIGRGFQPEIIADLSRRWATHVAAEYDLRQKSFRQADFTFTYHGDCLDYSLRYSKLRGFFSLGVAFPANAFGPPLSSPSPF